MNSEKTIDELCKLFHDQLSADYSARDIDRFIALSFHQLMDWNKLDISLNKQLDLEDDKYDQFNNILDRLKNSEPIQYILGSTLFYDLEIKVSSAVLIPRPETEELVELVSKHIKDGDKILDIGTGSGCIALALKSKIKNLQVKGIDISEDALQIARLNAKNLQLEIDLEKKDILFDDQLGKWNCIVSNPPYITKKEVAYLGKNVLDHEPETALFVPNKKPLLFYERIATLAIKSLLPNGFLFFEIHEEKGPEIVKLLASLGFENVEVKKDLQGKDRMVKAAV